MNERYITADRVTELLRSRTILRFNKMQKTIALAGFDELTVVKTIKKTYRKLDKDVRELLLELAIAVYEEAHEELKKTPKTDADELQKLVNRVLSTPNAVTMYSYDAEVFRKRDRLTEAIEAGKDTATEYRRSLGLWANMAAQYADIVTDEVYLQAYIEAGIKYVRWVTQENEKVCKPCNEKNDTVYPINEAPPKEHWHCRCYLVPVNDR